MIRERRDSGQHSCSRLLSVLCLHKHDTAELAAKRLMTVCSDDIYTACCHFHELKCKGKVEIISGWRKCYVLRRLVLHIMVKGTFQHRVTGSQLNRPRVPPANSIKTEEIVVNKRLFRLSVANIFVRVDVEKLPIKLLYEISTSRKLCNLPFWPLSILCARHFLRNGLLVFSVTQGVWADATRA